MVHSVRLDDAGRPGCGPLRPRRPSPTLVLLPEIRTILLRLARAIAPQAAFFIDIGAAVEQVRSELVASTR